jgi:hypothetical protein
LDDIDFYAFLDPSNPEVSHYRIWSRVTGENENEWEFVRMEHISGPVRNGAIITGALDIRAEHDRLRVQAARLNVPIEEFTDEDGETWLTEDCIEYIEYARSPRSLRKLIARRARNADTEDVK